MKCIHFALVAVIFAAMSCKSGNGSAKTQTAENPNHMSAVDFNADSAYNYVKAQVDFGPRVPGSDGHKKCQDYIKSRLVRFGADTIIEQSFSATNYIGTEMSLKNIMGRYNPEAKDRVLLLAHWDTRPWADADPDINKRNIPVPGANDGGSGVGVLLELARHFNEKRPQIGVDLLFVDGEDSGNSGSWGTNEETWCLGTQYWVKHMPYTPENMPRYGILLDMVGGIDAKFYREYLSQGFAESVNDKVWSHASAAGYDDYFLNDVRGGITDDHLFVNRAGIPCIDIIECSHPSTGSFSPVWHTVSDDLAHISKSSLKAVGQTVANTIYNEKASK